MNEKKQKILFIAFYPSKNSYKHWSLIYTENEHVMHCSRVSLYALLISRSSSPLSRISPADL